MGSPTSFAELPVEVQQDTCRDIREISWGLECPESLGFIDKRTDGRSAAVAQYVPGDTGESNPGRLATNVIRRFFEPFFDGCIHPLLVGQAEVVGKAGVAALERL